MRGMITGLTLDDSLNDLAAKFNVTLEVCASRAGAPRPVIDYSGDRAADAPHR